MLDVLEIATEGSGCLYESERGIDRELYLVIKNTERIYRRLQDLSRMFRADVFRKITRYAYLTCGNPTAEAYLTALQDAVEQEVFYA